MPIFKGVLDKRIIVLKLLKKKPSNKNQVSLKTSLTYKTASIIFKELRDNKMIELVILETDSRQHQYKITEKGLNLLKMFK